MRAERRVLAENGSEHTTAGGKCERMGREVRGRDVFAHGRELCPEP